jgi:hypothetical protein
MSEIKSALSAKRLTKALDGVKHHPAPPTTADSIARKPGSRIHRTKEDKPDKQDGDSPRTHRH